MKVFTFALSLSLIATAANAADFKTLSTDTTSWDGQAIEYPDGEPEVTGIKLIIKPKDQLPFHCHPYSTVGFITKGELEVEKLNGEKHKFSEGETIVEVANTWHRGRNPSASKSAELIGFYIGEKDQKNTIMMTEDNKDICK